MTVGELLAQIKEAWAHANYPGDAHISNGASPEAMQIASFFRGKVWKDITLEALRAYPGDASKCLKYMSAGAFQYYIAASMLIALDRYENHKELSTPTRAIATSAVYDLNPPPFGLFKRERVTSFSLSQRRAIVEFLRFVACNFPEDYPMDEPQRAFAYWSNVTYVEGLVLKAVTYRDTTIVRVGAEGLHYLDNEGRACFIDFSECCSNFQRRTRLSFLDSPNKYVGFRNSSVSSSYIELMTEPPTRFEFAKPVQRSVSPGSKFSVGTIPRGYLECLALLAEAGVATGDLN